MDGAAVLAADLVKTRAGRAERARRVAIVTYVNSRIVSVSTVINCSESSRVYDQL